MNDILSSLYVAKGADLNNPDYWTTRAKEYSFAALGFKKAGEISMVSWATRQVYKSLMRQKRETAERDNFCRLAEHVIVQCLG